MFLSIFLLFAQLPSVECFTSLTVSTSSSTGIGGIQFDVQANSVPITISRIMFSFNGGSGSQTYRLYYKVGSLSGSQFNSGAWTQKCQAATTIGWTGIYTNTGNSIYNGVTDANLCSVTIPAGQKYAFYIHGDTRGLTTSRTSGNFNTVTASDSFLSVYVGLGLSSNYPSYDPFRNGYGNDYYCKPKVRLYYSYPTQAPTPAPTTNPTKNPTPSPTSFPTPAPTDNPTKNPTPAPTFNPTPAPTDNPTTDPTPAPTDNPTREPTIDPTADPTKDPTADPTLEPTSDPTIEPTNEP